jgi:hypothetical protein
LSQVSQLREGGPADNQGVLIGDVIEAVDGISLQACTQVKLIDILKPFKSELSTS